MKKGEAPAEKAASQEAILNDWQKQIVFYRSANY